MEAQRIDPRAEAIPSHRPPGRMIDVPIAELETAVVRALSQVGAAPKVARRAARELVSHELDGAQAHGLQRLAVWIAAIQRGDLDPRATPRVERTAARAWRVDAGASLPTEVARQVRETLIEGAQDGGIASVAVVGPNPLGRLASVAAPVAEEGLLVLGFQRSAEDAGTVVPHGGRVGKLGSNPLVFAAPTGDAETNDGPARGPVVVDLTTSAASAADVHGRVARQEPVPDGWLADRDGHPVHRGEDLAAGLAYLQPLGGRAQGAKGFGLGLMVEILAGVLTGNRPQADEAGEERALFLALPTSLAGRDEAAVRRDVGALADELREGGEGDRVSIPGWASRARRREHLLHGSLAVPTGLWRQVLRLADGGDSPIEATPTAEDRSASTDKIPSAGQAEGAPRPARVVTAISDHQTWVAPADDEIPASEVPAAE